MLCSLARSGFPAERPADADPVSMHEGQAVTVTEYVTGKTPPPTQATFRTLGDLLGRLHGLAPGAAPAPPAGGAWHQPRHRPSP